jgi:microcystin-dependent protein
MTTHFTVQDVSHDLNILKSHDIALLKHVTYYTQAFIGDYKYTTRDEDLHGWLICDGRSLDRELYAGLYDVVGTDFGSNDAATFKLPDFRGKVPGMIGSGAIGSSNLTPRVLGDAVGYETHKLSVGEMPSHNHGGVTGAGGFGTGIEDAENNFANGTNVADDGGNHTHSISSQGGDQAHNNMQPTLFGGNVMIFAGLVIPEEED